MTKPKPDELPALDESVLLIPAPDLAMRLSVSRRTLHMLVATGAMPKPVHLGRRALWRVEEIEAWVRDGCPPIERWERTRSLPMKPPAKQPRRPATDGR